jgi:hypothetical protein
LTGRLYIIKSRSILRKGEAMYYNGNEALTHNKLFNFIVGNRGSGKTFWSKEWAIKDFIKNKNQFVYLRRYKEELKAKSKFFDDINYKFPDIEFKIKGQNILINDEIAGTFMSLSTAKINKSNAYPNVNKIIFDEFILDKGYYHYIPDEVVNFLELYETISRMRIDSETMKEINPVRVFFLSNAITVSNPYFLYFNMRVNPDKKFQHFKDDLLVELVANRDFIEMKKKTRFGKLISGTSYGDYAIENSFYRDDKTFIEKKTGNSRHYFTFKYYDRYYHVWLDVREGKFFISKDKDPAVESCYCLTQSDHSPNTFLTKGSKDYRLKLFLENYKMGNVYYEDINLKNVTFEIIKLFLL